MERRYWIAVASREHVLQGVDGGFCQVCHGKAAPLRQMAGSDLLAYYSPKEFFLQEEPCRKFTALGKISPDLPYQFEMAKDFIPWRRDVIFLKANEAKIEPLIANLSFIHDKTRWGFPFRRGCFTIPESDFRLIAGAMGVNVDEGL